MFSANLVKHLFCGAVTTAGYIVQTLTNAFLGVGAGGDVEQPLIGLGILHNGGCLPLNCEHDGAFTLLQLLQKLARAGRKIVSD
jgi:hypothetical protein